MGSRFGHLCAHEQGDVTHMGDVRVRVCSCACLRVEGGSEKNETSRGVRKRVRAREQDVEG
eukprot:3603427-Pleurochrysis_carterae.AAC.2